MLTRVEISGFKSFLDFALDLEPLVMVLGPNSAGKSNLFDALALISRLSSMEISKALQGGRGSIRDQFSRTPDGIAEAMSFGVELLVPNSEAQSLAQTRFRYELSISRTVLPSGLEEFNVARETLYAIPRAQDTWIEHHLTHAGFARYADAEMLLNLEDDDELFMRVVDRSADTNPVPHGAGARRMAAGHNSAGMRGDLGNQMGDVPADTVLLAEARAGDGKHILAVAKELRGWRFLHLATTALRQGSERGARARLEADGSNLPTALAALPDEARARIRGDMAELVPGLKTFHVTGTDDELGIEVIFSDGQHYAQRVLSDGTLRLLALLTMLYSTEPGALVAYEEPENGLFPGRLRELLRRLRELIHCNDALPVQILMNGHSPAIVAGLHDLPGSLVFADLVRRKDGVRRTRIRGLAVGPEPSDPATTISMRAVEALLDAARPEPAE